MPFMCGSLHHHEMRKDFGRKFVPPRVFLFTFLATVFELLYVSTPFPFKNLFLKGLQLYVMPFMCASLHHHEMRKDFGRKFVPPSGHDAIWRPYLGSFLNIMPEIVRCGAIAYFGRKNSSKRREISTPSQSAAVTSSKNADKFSLFYPSFRGIM